MNDNQNLPINLDTSSQVGTITYANEVIAIIAGMATYEVEGVVSAVPSGGIADLFGRKPVTRGVKVEVGTEETSVDIVITVEYGKPVQKVAAEVQENVRKAIETMTGLHVLKVDVHVTAISFQKEKEEIQEGYVKATASTADPDDIDTDIELDDDDIDMSDSADVDSPPEGVDPDDLPVRNIHMNDGRMQDEAEDTSANMQAQQQTPEDKE